ncbi:hypothetical protein BY458DRAFT_550823 [Sporodiniella umbellata]|nr:hypothetical protein BY458DRAFT_550823 [Sporodiniella umbellata]
MASSNFEYSSRSKTIEVPLQQEQVLEVVCNDLPANPVELTDIFRQESVRLPYYRMLAIEYYEQNKIEQSIMVVEAALSMASRSAHIQPRQKLPLLTLIATLNLRLAKNQIEERQKYLVIAVKFINEMDRIYSQYEPTFILKGNMYILQNKLSDAISYFNMLLEKRPDCIPALFGKAKVQYYLKQYKGALKTYQDALRYNRSNLYGVEIRLGIAQCFAQLKMYTEAKAALKRCIDISQVPNAAVLIMLAILELNESKRLENEGLQQEISLRHAFEHIQQSHQANTNHPVTLNIMANHFFLILDFEKTMNAASRALTSATSHVTKAEASYQIARAHHQTKDFENAFKFYTQALELYPDHLLAQFGVGQMQIQRGELTTAVETFEKLHIAEPQAIEVTKILGSLYVALKKQDKSNAILDKLLKHAHEDPFLCMEIAEMYEEKNKPEALKYYLQGLELIESVSQDDELAQERVKQIKPELLNNIAVMHHLLGKYLEAEGYYSLAIQAAENHTEGEKDLKLTMSYNLARLYEEKRETDKATAIYTKLIEDYPSYVDAHLRMGSIEQSLGRPTEAIEFYKEVFDSDSLNVKAWIMIGQAQALSTEKLSKRSFEKVLKDCDKNDIYTHVALGNYHCMLAQELKSESLKQPRIDAFKLAANFYSQALRRDPTNVYAANGLAITIAENGHNEQARDLFNQVRESNVSNPDALVNLAHTYVELKQYKQAIVMYENCLKKFYNNKDTELLLCLARTQYILGKLDKNHETMYDALRNTQRAYQLKPWDKTTWYDLALVQQSYAQHISDMPQDQRESTNMRSALGYLECSQRMFHALIHVEERTLYDKKIVEQRERYGETLRTQLERKLAEQNQFEEEKHRKMEIAKLKREEEAAKQREAEDKKRRLEELEKEEMEESRRRLMQKVREDNLLMATRQVDEDDEEEEKVSRKRRRKQKERDSDDEKEDDK